MCTTVNIDDDLFRNLKAQAAQRGTTLAALVNDLLRQASVPKPATGYKLELETFDGELMPGVDILDRKSLCDIMDGL